MSLWGVEPLFALIIMFGKKMAPGHGSMGGTVLAPLFSQCTLFSKGTRFSLIIMFIQKIGRISALSQRTPKYSIIAPKGTVLQTIKWCPKGSSL